MKLFSKLFGWLTRSNSVTDQCAEPGQRRCRFESLEERRMLDASPLFAGSVYWEPDEGSETTHDTIEVAFVGGTDNTRLTDFTIDLNPILYFDVAPGGGHPGISKPFTVDESQSVGIAAADVTSVQVADGGKSLQVSVNDFRPGDKLVFHIDVDHDLDGRFDDPIASAAEFQYSTLSANFFDPNYVALQVRPTPNVTDPAVINALAGSEDAIYWNDYDANFAGSGVESILRSDNFLVPGRGGQENRTDGTVIEYRLQPKPVTIAGTVWHDVNMNLQQEPTEDGIPQVTLSLWKKDQNGVYQDTGITTQTDSDGDYKFGLEHNLTPGTYRVVETQPPTYSSVGAVPGTVQTTAVGQTVTGDPDVLTEITIPLGDQHAVDYDFGEIQFAAIHGKVYLSDRDGNCNVEEHSTPLRPIEGVTIRLLDENGNVLQTATTDASGDYWFKDLAPGTYGVEEVTPPGLLDGDDHVGTINNVHVGAVTQNDRITSILLDPGDVGEHYDFCEHLPSSISGYVYHDANNNGLLEPGEDPIPDATLTLYDAAGNVLATETTDSNGFYKFDNLKAGTYRVVETQPPNYLDGKDTAGLIDGNVVGVAGNDVIGDIVLPTDEDGIEYNFGEVLPASIAGIVHVDPNRNCLLEPGEQTLQGVVIELLDANGDVIDTTQTDANGHYKFDNLTPGVYSVRETQPSGYFHGGQVPGAPNGDASVADLISGINIESGDRLTEYNFCEVPPSSLSGYVFQDGPAFLTPDGLPPVDLNNFRDGRLTSDDTPIPGVLLELRNGLTGEPITADQALPGQYPAGPIFTYTDSQGFYQFRGLPAGNYAVFEVHPSNFFDGIDTPGTTSGIAFNKHETVPAFVLTTLTNDPRGDAIVRIPLGVGEHSELNNFSEVQAEPPIEFPPPEFPPPPEVVPPPPIIPPAGLPPVLFLPPPPPVIIPDRPIILGSGGDYTWHLSVIDAGFPRGNDPLADVDLSRWNVVSFLDRTEWSADKVRSGRWTLSTGEVEGETVRTHVFGIYGAIPVVGDFNGDGKDELALYYNGEWFVDLNGNGMWDESDLWARLGNGRDRPVTGDWDGDGKDDIGIFGPAWMLDDRAIKLEPGLPDQMNIPKDRPKNVPPKPHEATNGHRLLRLTSRREPRADVIDHVFRYGVASDVPLAGDWNGDGITTIGIFRDGRWNLDIDGDGQWSETDIVARFGQAGDIPVVGDFNGDGIDEIGVYRAGRWIIDINGNHEMDAHDKVFEMGGKGDLPIAGDWDGDGADEPGLYHEMAPQAADQARL